MQSPRDARSSLESREILPGLVAFACPTTGGCWIDGEAYWNWLRAQPGFPHPTPAVDGPPVSLEADATKALLSPRSGRLMRKYRVGRGLDFSIDFDSSTGGFWLDREELETLQARSMQDELHLICSPEYQAQLRAMESAAARSAHARAALGPELMQAIDGLVAAIAASPQRERAIAYLREQLELPHA